MADYLCINGPLKGTFIDHEFDWKPQTKLIFGKPQIGSTGPNGRIVHDQGTRNLHYQLEAYRVPNGDVYLIAWTIEFNKVNALEMIQEHKHERFAYS